MSWRTTLRGEYRVNFLFHLVISCTYRRVISCCWIWIGMQYDCDCTKLNIRFELHQVEPPQKQQLYMVDDPRKFHSGQYYLWIRCRLNCIS